MHSMSFAGVSFARASQSAGVIATAVVAGTRVSPTVRHRSATIERAQREPGCRRMDVSSWWLGQTAEGRSDAVREGLAGWGARSGRRADPRSEESGDSTPGRPAPRGRLAGAPRSLVTER